jgi:hypothetical protein
MTKFADCTTKTARIAHIRKMLSVNPQWALRGLLRIYERQTADEQASQTTRIHNAVGFTGADATILSSLAEQVNNGRRLSEKQMAILFKRIPKYAKQLESIATNGNNQ